MKILEYKYQILSFLLALVIIFMYLNQHDHSHSHEDEHAQEENLENPVKEKQVALNPAQYLNAEIDTGWFSMKNISNVINASGYTKLDPQDQAMVGAKVNGTVKNIKIIEGDYVKRGQLLASMSSLDYNKLLIEDIKLNEQIETHTAQVGLLESELRRQEALAAENINAKKVLEQIKTNITIERQQLEGVKKQLKITRESINVIGGGGTSEVLIKAPISGYVTDVNVIIGSQVMEGKKLFSIVDNAKMHVDLLVYEKDLDKVQIGQKVRFILTNQSNKEISGRIYNIGKSFAKDSKSVEVHADIENNDEDLIPGMYVNALIDIGEEKVSSLPEEAIVFAEGRNFVFIWNKGNRDPLNSEEINFSRLEVKTGAEQLGFVEVTPLGNYNQEDRIVVMGAYYLQSHLQKSEGGGGHHH